MADQRTLATVLAVVAIAAVLLVSPADARPKPQAHGPTHYDTKGGPVNDRLNVHVVMHTHDDVGWLKTVDQYFMGSNNSIQAAGVQYILDSVMVSLAENPDRKFIYVEVAFFKRWWDQQTPAMQEQVQRFVANGQLEFINGGYCMSDEAAPSYVDMIDQQTLGHQFLRSVFGADAVPVTGWQIDPFGHSNTMAVLYSLMGMNSWFFARADYQDVDQRNKQQNCETVMRPSQSLGPNVDIFTGYMHGYGPVDGFNWDTGSSDAPMQDDPELHDVNVQDRVNQFVLACLAQAKLYRTNNIMLSMGSDFEFSNANTWYKNMDKLLHYLKIDGRLNAFYSTPTIYTQSKHDANITWTTKDDDWFPYADFDHAFWTGYFTSRPAFKAYVRSRSNLLQGCRHMELQTPTLTLSSFQLWEAMSVSQHHDGVSGTEKQHVTYDYTERLSSGSEECHGLFNQAYRKMYGTGGAALTFVDCPYINESICEPTTTLSKLPLAVSLYNTLGQARSEFIRLPIAAGANLTVYDRNGHVVTSDVFTSEDGSEDLFFVATMPPVGYNTYVLAPTAHENRRHQFQRERQSERRSKAEPTATQTIENKFYELTFTDGLLSQITNKASGLSTKITQSLFWYNASAGNTAEDFNQGQASGAYIFRPNCTENVMTPCKPFAVSNEAPTIDVVQTELVQVVHQIFSSWAEQRVILYADSDAIDIEYTVGPIPFEDGLGREIVSVFQSDITNDVFWTDANGREMQKRKQNFRPTWTLNVTDPVSSNFYPVDHCIFITDSAPIGGKQRQLTIITDRSHGGASLGEGELEVMVHRRTLYDDHRGVGEPMNETGVSGQGLVVTGTHRVTFGDKVDGPKMQKDNTQRLTFAPIIHFAEVPFGVDTFVKDFTLTRTALTSALPPNVHLLHMHDNYVFTRANEMILRLAHLYEAGEDPDMSKPVDVDLSSLLSTISIVSCTEMSLTANQKLSNVHRMTWRTESNGEARYTPTRTPFDVGSFIVTLNPMDIRTFSCEYNP